MLRRTLIVPSLAIVSLIAPASASAMSDVTLSGGLAGASIFVTGNNGGSTVTIGKSGNVYSITDSQGGATTSSPGCMAVAQTVNCTVGGTLGSLTVFSAGGPDSVTLFGSIPSQVRTQLTGGDGNDTLTGANGADQLDGQGDKDTLNGNSGSDALFGRGDRDSLNGGGGSDLMNGGDAGDDYNGGSGADTASYALQSGGNRVKLGGSQFNDGGPSDGFSDRIPGNVENFEGSRGRDKVTGNSKRNDILGRAGNDLLKGLGGPDRLNGGSGNDFLAGGAGQDRCNGSSGRDRASSCFRSRRIP